MTDATRLERPDGFSLALNYLPLLHIVSGVGLAWAFDGVAARAAVLLLWLYLLPPVVSRATLAAFGRPAGRATLDSRDYRIWWFLTQWQMVFNQNQQRFARRMEMYENIGRVLLGYSSTQAVLSALPPRLT